MSTTDQAVAALLEEAKGMVGRPPTEHEVEKAKQTLLASFVFQVDSPKALLQRFLTFEYYGYSLDRLAEYRAKIEAVTTADVRKAAATYLTPQDFSIVVVGPSEGRSSDLSEFGPVQHLDISIPPPPEPPPMARPAPGQGAGGTSSPSAAAGR